MRKYLFFPFLMFAALANGQITSGTDTLYGNEWIDYSKTYYKIRVAEDGVYRIPASVLSAAGLGSVTGEQFRLYGYGQERPIYTTTNTTFGPNDFIEFYAEKNRHQLDSFLFESPSTQNINPEYSIITDTATYFLTWATAGNGLRYTDPGNDLSNLPAPEPYIWFEIMNLYRDNAMKRERGFDITYSWYDGEGFSTWRNVLNINSLNAIKPYLNGPVPLLNFRYACFLGSHNVVVSVNDSVYFTDAFNSFGVRQYTVPVKKSLLPNFISLKTESSNGASIAFVKLRYPRLPDMSGALRAEFWLEDNGMPRYLALSEFNTDGQSPILYDVNNGLRIVGIVENNQVKIKLPGAGGGTRRLFLANTVAGIRTVNELRPRQFRNYTAENADYLIISNPALYKDPADNNANQVEAYADYRRSPAGGNHQVVVADINELYDQFAYGVRYHPISIWNFVHWGDKQWDSLAHVFLIGKGLDYFNFRQTYQQNAAIIDSLYFLPAYGYHGADMPFVMSAHGLSDPIASIGRLAVTKPSEIKIYLDKVIEHEQTLTLAGQTILDKAWMKRVIHNSGGFGSETFAIRSYTSDMATVLSNNRFGADVYPFYKTSNDPIQLSAFEQILDLVNGGVSMWTIFGHSSPFAVDFDIGSPYSYNNKGKYPLMLIMGCFSGICSVPDRGIGEQFIFAPERGAIAYIASVNYSFIDALHDYGRKYYELAGGEDYGHGIGQTLIHAVRDMKNTNNERLVAVLHQNLLQGDPAVAVHAHPGPDFVVDNQSLQIKPNPIALEESNYEVRFDIVNIGENTGVPLTVAIEQQLPLNGPVIARLQDTIISPANRVTLSYQVDNAASQIGFNRLFIKLDDQNQVAEAPAAAEMNNTLVDASGNPGAEVYIYANDVSPIYPLDFSIVDDEKPTLAASTLNTSAASLRYLFQLDTVETFNSPFLKAQDLTSPGGLLEWPVPVALADSTVYFWRVARDSLVNGALVWRNGSFIRLASQDEGGWNQAHFGQYKKNLLADVQLNDTTRQLEFVPNAGFVDIRAAYINNYNDVGPGISNSTYQGWYGAYGWIVNNMWEPGVALMVLNPQSGRAVTASSVAPNNPTPGRESLFRFYRTKDSLERIALMNFIEAEMPDGYYGAMLTITYNNTSDAYGASKWALDSVSYGKNLFEILEAQGAREVRDLAAQSLASPPYAFIFQKNTPSFTAIDTITAVFTAPANIRRNFQTKWSFGFMESPAIGPVKSWKKLQWSRAEFDDPSDEARLSVWGVRENFPDTLLHTFETTFDTTLAFINSDIFPKLKWRYDLVDTATRTATPLNFVRFLYEGLPEGALHPVAQFNFYADTLQQGDQLSAAVQFKNVSDYGMDSLLVKFRIENEAGQGVDYYKRFKPLPVGTAQLLDIQSPTKQFTGRSRLLVDVNPNADQPEMFHFNNVLVKEFYIQRDQRNPLLDVTFDGMHIFDGDLISPKPFIVATLKDDNRFLAMSDTSTFTLTLILPDGSNKRLSFLDPELAFFPADAAALPSKNKARIEWRPTFTVDGDYRLVVSGRDASGNNSGSVDYVGSFRVITKSSISHILNYPNPFSTSTCFVYTMTGAEQPSSFRLQIMTVSGKVVREVTEAEFGPLQAGTHTSNFCWDGRDQYGDQLANGVYLYRIVAKKADGSDFEFYENRSIDPYFKHGFGKMVLMR